MGNFMKVVGLTLLIIMGISVAAGIGLMLSALSSVIGFVALGAIAIVFFYTCAKEYLATKAKRDR